MCFTPACNFASFALHPAHENASTVQLQLIQSRAFEGASDLPTIQFHHPCAPCTQGFVWSAHIILLLFLLPHRHSLLSTKLPSLLPSLDQVYTYNLPFGMPHRHRTPPKSELIMQIPCTFQNFHAHQLVLAHHASEISSTSKLCTSKLCTSLILKSFFAKLNLCISSKSNFSAKLKKEQSAHLSRFSGDSKPTLSCTLPLYSQTSLSI